MSQSIKPHSTRSTLLKFAKNGMKTATNPQTYTMKNAKIQWQRSQRFVNLLMAIVKGMGYAYEVNQRQLAPAKIIPLTQKFCANICQGLAIEVIAIEPIPQTQALWASNHISWVDIAVVGSVVPTFFLSKAEIAQWPVIGWLARSANTLFIQRGSGDTGSVSQQMARFLADGFPVVFFPEATTTDGTQIKRLHSKLFQSAIDANVPIQAVVICYVDEQGNLDTSIPYYGEINMLESVKKVIDNRPAKAYILPLESLHPAGKSKEELTQILQERMTLGLQRLHQLVLKK